MATTRPSTDSTNSTGLRSTYPPYANAESLRNYTPDIYDQNTSVIFQSYQHVPQMSHRPYAPSSIQLPSLGAHGQLYPEEQFPSSVPAYYQPLVSPSIRGSASLSPVPQATIPIDFTQFGNNETVQPRHICPSLFGYSGRGSNLIENSGGFSLMQQGFERLGLGGLGSDVSKPINGQSSLIQLSSAAASPKLIDLQELPGINFRMASQHEGLGYGSSSCTSSYHRGYSSDDHGFGYRSVSTYNPGINGQCWSIGKEANGGRGTSDFLCSCTGMLGTLTAQSRGPRALKPKSLRTANGSTVDESKNGTSSNVRNEYLNLLDTASNYKDAKFFVIKSYSEDNVHKSIKYSVWASTPSGNKKLDAAYRDAKEKEWDIPIFLLFSVNASAQFCGVAEMVGPVDFDNSVDYWQQDKWTGQFPVKWHIIKDVPNSQFRHIIVKDNDNKPVTNSRDTQEVELQLGIDMLNIFKNYEAHSSILDDFDFYEDRHKAMQERKAGRQTNPVSMSVIGGNASQHPNIPCRYSMSY
ncbi:YTH domain containing protein [Parasponia andersonii]|uniref:YTH domain-containing family protein n=1 Tax=Parasponia andersonii TaxID=3476 RepID=A0A2P5BPF9_PARAD|nr:YTH domain containing protein [Parasponia andersonii]